MAKINLIKVWKKPNEYEYEYEYTYKVVVSTLFLKRMQAMLILAVIAHLLLKSKVFIEGKCMVDWFYYEACQEGVATPCLQVICMMVSKISFIILLSASGV
jgi:hypothetical protein